MNKDKWLTLELSVVPEETVKTLLEMSFDLTVPKKPGRKNIAQPVGKKPRDKVRLNHKTCGIWDCGHNSCGWRRIA